MSGSRAMARGLDLSLYLVASRGARSDDEFLRVVERALQGGVRVVQLREKQLESREYYVLACKLKALTDRFSVPLLINDRVDIALACGASGVHIGASDLPLECARKILGDDKIIGCSLRDPALLPNVAGADYLGVGAVFPTQTKDDSVVIGVDGVREILEHMARAHICVPVVAIGGINAQNLQALQALRALGLSGVAVSSAIMHAPDPLAAARELSARLDSGVESRRECGEQERARESRLESKPESISSGGWHE